MAKVKRKTLPKDFETLLERGDIAELKALFDSRDVNARGGLFKQTTLAFNDCPDELARWLVENGADLSAGDRYGETPLHARSRHWQGRIAVLLALGADVHARDNSGDTPLHFAAGVGNITTARLLLEHGARIDCLNEMNMTPLVWALHRCRNSDIKKLAAMAELLLDAQAQNELKLRSIADRTSGGTQRPSDHVTPEMRTFVQQIGTEFEFHRETFNPEYLDETSAALDRLYELFDVPPIPRRVMHDGKSPIVAKAAVWEDQHQELWELLVPSQCAASTVQGEVIRISGRIHIELAENDGINWDLWFKQMADTFLAHVGSGVPLPSHMMLEARRIVAAVKRRNGDTIRLCELAVEWVSLNPTPMTLPKPDYPR